MTEWYRESEWTLGVGEGQGSLACCSLWGCKESNTTEQLNNNNKTMEISHSGLTYMTEWVASLCTGNSHYPCSVLSQKAHSLSWHFGDILIRGPDSSRVGLANRFHLKSKLGWLVVASEARSGLNGKTSWLITKAFLSPVEVGTVEGESECWQSSYRWCLRQVFWVVQWSRLCTSTSWGTGLIPGQGTKIPTCCGMVRKNKTRYKRGKKRQVFCDGKQKSQCPLVEKTNTRYLQKVSAHKY